MAKVLFKTTIESKDSSINNLICSFFHGYISHNAFWIGDWPLYFDFFGCDGKKEHIVICFVDVFDVKFGVIEVPCKKGIKNMRRLRDLCESFEEPKKWEKIDDIIQWIVDEWEKNEDEKYV